MFPGHLPFIKPPHGKEAVDVRITLLSAFFQTSNEFPSLMTVLLLF